MDDIIIEVEGKVEPEDILEYNIKAGTAVLSMLYFREEEIVGSIEVNNMGQISASVEDEDAKKIVIPDFIFINGKDSPDLEQFGFVWDLSNELDRWNKIKKLIPAKGLEIHYSEDRKMDEKYRKNKI